MLTQIPAGSSSFRFASRKQLAPKEAATGAFFRRPIRDEKLKLARQSTESPTITDTGESEGEITTGETTEAGFTAVWRARAWDDYVAAAIWSPGWLGSVAGFPFAAPPNVAITDVGGEFNFASGTAQLPVLAAGDVVVVSDADNWIHVGAFRVTNTVPPTASVFRALRLDGKPAAPNAASEALQITKVGEYGSFTLTAAPGGATATIDILDAAGAAAALARGWVRLGNFAAAGNNGTWRVTGAAGTELTIARDNAAGVFVTGTDASSFWAAPEVCRNGNTQTLFTEEKRWDLATDIYNLYVDQSYSQMEISTSVGDLVQVTFTGAGRTMTTPGVPAGSSYVAFPDTREASMLDVSALLIGGTLIPHRSNTWSFNKNQAPIQEVGIKGASQYRPGALATTGSIEAFTEDMAQVQRFINESLHPVEMCINSPDGNGYVLRCPRAKLTQADNNVTGKDTDTFTQITWSARRDPDLGFQTEILRFLA